MSRRSSSTLIAVAPIQVTQPVDARPATTTRPPAEQPARAPTAPVARPMPIFVPRTKLSKTPDLPEQARRPPARREPRDFVIDLAAIERELCAA